MSLSFDEIEVATIAIDETILAIKAPIAIRIPI